MTSSSIAWSLRRRGTRAAMVMTANARTPSAVSPGRDEFSRWRDEARSDISASVADLCIAATVSAESPVIGQGRVGFVDEARTGYPGTRRVSGERLRRTVTVQIPVQVEGADA